MPDIEFYDSIEISNDNFQRLFKYGRFLDLYVNQSEQFSNN